MGSPAKAGQRMTDVSHQDSKARSETQWPAHAQRARRNALLLSVHLAQYSGGIHEAPAHLGTHALGSFVH
eukprot:scaffold199562_cov23-Tisochrysis_lutea.AAC.2